MKTLAALVRELEDQLAACTRCGMCQAVCPLFRETGREAGVARGKLAILKGLMREAFREPQRSLEEINRCLLCGSCEANCPSGVRVLEIFLKARAILTGYLGMPPAKRLAFRNLVAHPARFDRFVGWAARVQGLLIKPADDLLGTSCTRFTSPLADRHFKALAAVPFHRRLVKNPPGRRTGRELKALFFYGCLIDKVYPDTGRAILKTLDRFGVEAVFPEGQGCCGLPALSAGDLRTFQMLVDFNLERISRQSCDVLVTACPTCAATIQKIWPIMARARDPEEQDRIRALAGKTMDITDFLVNRVGVEPLAGAGKNLAVTYHDPCHLKKSLGVAAPPRHMLQALPGLDFREMVEADACCGCGGSFTLEHYELSRAVGLRKLENIRQSGAEVVATACPACMLQITDLLSRGGDRIRVRHVLDLWAEGLPETGTDKKTIAPGD
jgi:glycolate oxidase iron-sulfur subunit